MMFVFFFTEVAVQQQQQPPPPPPPQQQQPPMPAYQQPIQDEPERLVVNRLTFLLVSKACTNKL
jgi:hypothetical protein